MRRLNVFNYALLAGICIALGGIAFLSIENRVTGAIFFSLGLFTILTNSLNLYTGKICYVFERDGSYLIDLGLIWLGNFAGAFITGSAVGFTRISVIAERALTVSQAKLDDGLLSIFILSILCNMLIYIAVDGFSRNKHEFGKYLGLVFGVAGFILCGFEHCVANMAYFTIAGVWSGKALIYIIVMTLGNSVGGVIFPLLRLFKDKTEAKN